VVTCIPGVLEKTTDRMHGEKAYSLDLSNEGDY